MKTSVTIIISALALFSAGKDVCAQLMTLPVSISPKETPDLPTLVVHGDFGFFNHNLGDFKSVGGRLVWNPARFSVLAGAGVLLAEADQADNGFTAGTAIGYDVRPGSPEPWKPIIQVKGGLGYTKISDFKQWDFPFALGIALFAPPPGFNVKLWGAPRLHLRIADDPSGGNSTELGFGLSAGLALTKLSGLGVHVDSEWLRIQGHHEFVVAAGLHWDFTLF